MNVSVEFARLAAVAAVAAVLWCMIYGPIPDDDDKTMRSGSPLKRLDSLMGWFYDNCSLRQCVFVTLIFYVVCLVEWLVFWLGMLLLGAAASVIPWYVDAIVGLLLVIMAMQAYIGWRRYN